MRDDPTTLTQRRPWLVAFAFGLLHGFGFAGALTEIGLPQTDVLWALLLFNLGVELGQLLVVIPAIGLLYLWHRMAGERSLPRWAAQAPVYLLGMVAT